jgi:type IX secretion system PorP/SprF family membrane protein
MRRIFFAILFFVSVPCLAQSPVFSHYPINPTLYNPAFAGIKGTSELSFNQRHQWLGVEDAPRVSTLQFHTMPVYKVGLGVQVQRFSRGIINTSQANLLFSYKVPFTRISSLHFGVSGGIRQVNADAAAIGNTPDPALGNLLNGLTEADVQFGVNYRIMGLNFGLVFNEMIPAGSFLNNTTDPSDIDFYQNYIAHIDYRFSFSPSGLGFQPFLLYRRAERQFSYLEGGGLMHWKETFYAGAAYRQNYGFSLLTGFELSKFRIGYAYEFANEIINGIGQGSHELQLSFRFGKKKSAPLAEKKKVQAKPEPKVEETTPQPEALADEKESVQEVIEAEPQQNSLTDSVKQAPEPEPQHAVYVAGNHPQEMPVGFYVIAGAFDNYENAKRLARELSKAASFAAAGYNSERKVYFVFVHRSSSLPKTREIRDDFRQQELLKDAWLLEIRKAKD